MKPPYYLYILILLLFLGILSCEENKNSITLESLLDEMVSVEELARFPDPYYTTHQETRHGTFIREETVGKRHEKVMLDETGPGVITRIWINGLPKHGTLRFYFNGSSKPRWVIPAFDFMQTEIPLFGKGLVHPHTNYKWEGMGGNALFLPIPYAKGCKITFEDNTDVTLSSEMSWTLTQYDIHFRKYSEETSIETFSPKVLERAANKIKETDRSLLSPPTYSNYPSLEGLEQGLLFMPGDSLVIDLPEGENAVYRITFVVGPLHKKGKEEAEALRKVIFSGSFDGKQTIWAPFSDFSGGGIGKPEMESWYLSNRERERTISRWLMPYQKNGTLKLINTSDTQMQMSMSVTVLPLVWDDRSLYFHSSWRQERDIFIDANPWEDHSVESDFAAVNGRGIYKGNLLSLYDHALVYTFQTPFGGIPRADKGDIAKFSAFFRTRHLDDIPFQEKYNFDIQIPAWGYGYVNYAMTTYWYGDANTKAIGTSGLEEVETGLGEPTNIPDDLSWALTVKKNYKFDDYKVNVYQGELAPPDPQTVPWGNKPNFIDFITTACKNNGINFAGHYTVIPNGCGMECVNIYIVDRIDGRIIDFEGWIDGKYGFAFKEDSQLMIANSYLFVDEGVFEKYHDYYCEPEFYLWEEETLLLLE